MGGETTRVENRGETTRGETTREETSWGRNVLGAKRLVTVEIDRYYQVNCSIYFFQLPRVTPNSNDLSEYYDTTTTYHSDSKNMFLYENQFCTN